MNPSSKFLPLSSLPRSISQIDPALTHPEPAPPPPPSLPSHDPSFRTAPEEPSLPTPENPTSSSLHAPPSEAAEEEEKTSVPTLPPIPPPPPNFTPYFTLLSSHSHSHAANDQQQQRVTTHHPTVHYIFADDPPDASPIADAALDLLDPPPPPAEEDDDDDDDGGNEAEEGGQATAERGRSGGSRKERYILLDMDVSGAKVRSAKSMSPDWAVTGAEVGMAPTWEGDGGEEVGSEAGVRKGAWMLRVEGLESFGKGGTGVREGEEGGLEELVEEYERRMGELRRVIGAGVETAGEEGEG